MRRSGASHRQSCRRWLWGTAVPVRCCQKNAGCCVGSPDETGSQGTSADDEVAVVGNSRSECRSVRGTNRNRDLRPAVESCRLCRRWSGWRASRSVIERRRGRCRRQERPRGVRGHFAMPGRRSRPYDWHPRPSDRYVREETGKETRRSVHSGRKAASWVC